MARLGTLLSPLLPALVVLSGAVDPAPLAGQRAASDSLAGPPVELSVEDGTGALTVRVGDVLASDEMRNALESGLPLRLHVRIQLWSDGFFDSQVGQWGWRARVVYDPLERRYLLEARAEPGAGPDASDDGSNVVEFATFPAVRAGIRRILDPGLVPPEPGSYYYTARVELETLSLTDLEELRRWLRGDLAEAVAGDRDVESAVERGLRRAVVRLLGVPERRYESRTSTFDVGS